MVRTLVMAWVKADKVVFLASADSNAMTGQCMHLVGSFRHLSESLTDVSEQRSMDWIGKPTSRRAFVKSKEAAV